MGRTLSLERRQRGRYFTSSYDFCSIRRAGGPQRAEPQCGTVREMSTLLVVRHGQASYGAADYDQLSDLGQEQGERLGAWLAARSINIDAMYVGPAKRHKQTAAAMVRGAAQSGLQLPEQIGDEGLGEFPAFELFSMHAGMELHEAAADETGPVTSFEDICHRWMLGTLDCGDLETAAAFEERVIASVNRAVADTGQGKTIAFITSGGPSMAVFKHVLGVPPERASALLWSIANASVSAYKYRGDTLTLTGFNRLAHLEREHVTYR